MCMFFRESFHPAIIQEFDYSTQVGALDDKILERCKAADVPAVLLQVCYDLSAAYLMFPALYVQY